MVGKKQVGSAPTVEQIQTDVITQVFEANLRYCTQSDCILSHYVFLLFKVYCHVMLISKFQCLAKAVSGREANSLAPNQVSMSQFVWSILVSGQKPRETVWC